MPRGVPTPQTFPGVRTGRQQEPSEAPVDVPTMAELLAAREERPWRHPVVLPPYNSKALTLAIIEEFCFAIKLGAHDDLALQLVDCTGKSMHRWCNKYPWVYERVQRAKAQRALRLLSVIQGGMETDPKLAVVLLKALYPQYYGNKATVTHEGTLQHQHSAKPTLDLSKLSREQLRQMKEIYDAAGVNPEADEDEDEDDDGDDDTPTIEHQEDGPDSEERTGDGPHPEGPRLLHP